MMKGRSTNRMLLFIFICAPFLTFSQNDDGLKLLKDADDNRIKFENYYYEALKYKAIGNYTRAITELEKCQLLFPDDTAVDFEFSKNYYHLNKYIEAQLYIEKALSFSEENYWFLTHAKNVYLKQFDYPKAIAIQKKMNAQKPMNTEDLVLLYIQANEREKAQALIEELESNGISSSKLRHYKELVLNTVNTNSVGSLVVENDSGSVDDLKSSYEKSKNFSVLQELLKQEYLNNNFESLIELSSEGLEIFPAQPFVYLMNAKAFIQQKKYTEAIDVLVNGLDFVVDDVLIEADFYEHLYECYKATGDLKRAADYRQKADKLKTPINK